MNKIPNNFMYVAPQIYSVENRQGLTNLVNHLKDSSRDPDTKLLYDKIGYRSVEDKDIDPDTYEFPTWFLHHCHFEHDGYGDYIELRELPFKEQIFGVGSKDDDKVS